MMRFTLKALIPAVFLLSGTFAVAQGEHDGNFIVQSVVPGSAAEAAGLEEGDNILRIGGLSMETQADLDQILKTHNSGDTVPLEVQRNGKTLGFELTFGERPGGGPSIGVSVAVVGMGSARGEAFSGPTLSREECVAWVDDRYRVETRVRELGLGLEIDAKTLRACLESNVQAMPSPMPVGWCDNAFKIHCSGLDLLTEIGEAEVEGEALLGEKLSSCAAQRVFDRYSMDGKSSDSAACGAAREACSAGQS